MKSDQFYVYCNGLLGVRTNLCDFKWIYGTLAPQSSEDKYDNCLIKFIVQVVPEKEMPVCSSSNQQFQAYMWDDEQKTIYYRKTLFSVIKVGYSIRFHQNEVHIFVGKNYWKYVKNRFMNLHGMYYLLADLANLILLKNGFLTLYASAAYSADRNRGIIFFAPPNTGKTITVTKLQETSNYKMVSEDIVITDGYKLFSCPWTMSYRKKTSKFNSGIDFRRGNTQTIQNICESCDLTDIAVLDRGEVNADYNKNEVLRKVRILNGYLFCYFSTPIVKILGYFDEEYDQEWNICAKDILKQMIDSSKCYMIHSDDPTAYGQLVKQLIECEIV